MASRNLFVIIGASTALCLGLSAFTAWGVATLVNSSYSDAAAQGVPGSDGAAGDDGTDGSAGKDGANGEDGVAGRNGASGSRGSDGDDGSRGTDGDDGAAGIPGATGSGGSAGSTGATGATGATGPQGPAGAPATSGPTITTGLGSGSASIIGGTSTPIASLAIPAGVYVGAVTGTIAVANVEPGDVVSCQTPWGSRGFSSGPSFELTGAGVIAAPNDITHAITCYISSMMGPGVSTNATVTWTDVTILAQPVG